MSDFYKYKQKRRETNKPVSQKVVRQKVKFDFRHDPEKKEIIEKYAEDTDTTFSDLMRLATDNLIDAIKQSELEGI